MVYLGDHGASLDNRSSNGSGDIIVTAFSKWSKKVFLFAYESLAPLTEERQVAIDYL